jgi:hypothetical protein
MANPAPAKISGPAALMPANLKNSRGIISDRIDAGYVLEYGQPSADNQRHLEQGLD